MRDRIPSPNALPPLPAITLDVQSNAKLAEGFLAINRTHWVARYPGGESSETFTHDSVSRVSLDGVVLLAHYEEHGERHVYLRSAVRPPLLMRPDALPSDANQWELPAGLIDADEQPIDAAVRELEEEIGFRVAPAEFIPVDEWTYPSSALIAERQFFFHVAVHPGGRGTPLEDGSPVERHATIVGVPIIQALEACRSGAIRDTKTELALRRFSDNFQR